MQNVSRSFQNEFNYNNEIDKKNVTVEGVFRIVIQRNLKEMVDLPEIKIWSVLPYTIQTRMLVRIRRYGFFLTRDSNETIMRCILTRKNYLIIYAKERYLKGYAVKLSLAEKLNILCNRLEKGFCVVTIKWRFGEITLTMLKEQAIDWRYRILEAFENSVEKNREVGVQTNEKNFVSKNLNFKNDLPYYKTKPISISSKSLNAPLKKNFPKSRSFEVSKNKHLDKNCQSNFFTSLQTLPPIKPELTNLKNKKKIRLISYNPNYEADFSSNCENESLNNQKKIMSQNNCNYVIKTPKICLNKQKDYDEINLQSIIKKKNPQPPKKPLFKCKNKKFQLTNNKNKQKNKQLVHNELNELATVNNNSDNSLESSYVYNFKNTTFQEPNLNKNIDTNKTILSNKNEFNQQKSLPLLNKEDLRRSWSSSAVDFSKLDEELNNDKLIVPRRPIGRIERPISNPTNFDACFTVIKRYGFDEPNEILSPLKISKFNRSPTLFFNSDDIQNNMQKARELFKERIAKDKIKILQNNDAFNNENLKKTEINTVNNKELPVEKKIKPILTSLKKSKSSSSVDSFSSMANSLNDKKVFFWPVSDSTNFFDANVNANTVNKNTSNENYWSRRFFESDA